MATCKQYLNKADKEKELRQEKKKPENVSLNTIRILIVELGSFYFDSNNTEEQDIKLCLEKYEVDIGKREMCQQL